MQKTLLLLASLGSAKWPNFHSSSRVLFHSSGCKAHSLTFENDVPQTPGVATGPVGNNGIYLDIFWKAFSLAATESSMTQDIPGVVPESPPNLIAFGTGDAETIENGQPQMTVNYPDSTIAWFDLSNFYYACSSGTETDLASVPASCNFTITGYGPPPASQEIAQQTFTYTMDGLIQDIDPAVVSSAFKTLYFVDFVITTTQLLGNATLAGLVDTVNYTVYSQSPITN